MTDLRLAMALMTLLSIASFMSVRRLCAKANPRVLDAAAAGLVLLIGVYIRFVWGQLWIVKWIHAAVGRDSGQLVSRAVGSFGCGVVATDGVVFDSSQNSDSAAVDCCHCLVGDLRHPSQATGMW